MYWRNAFLCIPAAGVPGLLTAWNRGRLQCDTHGCKANRRHNNMLSIFTLVLQSCKTMVLYDAASRATTVVGKVSDMLLSSQVLSDMNTHRVQMNSHIFTAFLQACTVVPLAAHQIEAVFGAMASYRASQPPTAFVYTSLLTFCAKQAPDRALDVWQAMQEVCCCHAGSSALDLHLQQPAHHSYLDIHAM